MVSIVEIILAVRAGLRNAVQMTMCPRRTRSVSAASAASDVKDSKVISSVGRGTVWKWSNSQIDSKPSRSACRATSVVRRQASSGVPAVVFADPALGDDRADLHRTTSG